MGEDKSQIQSDYTQGPKVEKVSRRRFLKLGLGSAAAVGAAAGGAVLLKRYFKERVPEVPSGCTLVRLSEMPNENPAFFAKAMPDGTLIVWAWRKPGDPLAYSLNANARLVWRLCDGRRTETEIFDLYHRKTGRDASEAEQVLKELMEKAVIVKGGYIVSGPGFPVTETSNARYLRRVTAEEMQMG